MTLAEYLHHRRHLENKDRAAWNRAASVQSMLANIHRRKGAAAFKPADFTPYTELDKQRERAEAASNPREAQAAAERFANILSHAR